MPRRWFRFLLAVGNAVWVQCAAAGHGVCLHEYELIAPRLKWRTFLHVASRAWSTTPWCTRLKPSSYAAHRPGGAIRAGLRNSEVFCVRHAWRVNGSVMPAPRAGAIELA